MSHVFKMPGWVVFHVPHNSTFIPPGVRDQFLLSESALQEEILRMTDMHTLELYTSGVYAEHIVEATVSRLVVDVERFADDEKEAMASRGMGVIYTTTTTLKPLRRDVSNDERNALLEKWYFPHHRQLSSEVRGCVAGYGRALIIDCHSFSSRPLLYEQDQRPERAEICIGTDSVHTPAGLTSAFCHAFEEAGFFVAIDLPFSGAMVPASAFGLPNVQSVMIEVRRDLYMDESTGAKLPTFSETAAKVQSCIHRAVCL